MQTEKEYVSERSIIGLHSESVGEYPLPDYNGDVKRVLMISPQVSPVGKYMNESALEFSGNVFYDVVYLDSENNISRAQFSTDYELAIKQDAESYRDSSIVTDISSYNVRLVGPRKFSVKASLVSDVRVLESKTVEIMGDAAELEDVETLCAEANVLSSVLIAGDPIEIREDLLFAEGAIEDEVCILFLERERLTEKEKGGFFRGIYTCIRCGRSHLHRRTDPDRPHKADARKDHGSVCNGRCGAWGTRAL
jgi:hypothetical protein